ncbi:hypothetical protein H310_07964 [Aphanomyces invadans]|uniref:RRM domain-containing protein n=1 Tax=Aphanomyces invadans TaxID=157072 RepID=A0A024U0M1_9STRA|nr:hypothetical protein H310_07964 [Aphanomyces invadans]ETV99945.1 hypothetical protein H310_07964 [Aphanomyces invadans]|eukprot:XP_008871721.1 hypothetical protein H310_07964 [Aphanomyces invadans]
MSDAEDGGSSSSFDSDHDGDFGEESMEETDQQNRVMQAVCKSCENPNDYNLHLAAITELSSSPVFASQLEQQFERFHKAFPLSLELWLQYIELRPEKLVESFDDYLLPALYYKYVEDVEDDPQGEERWSVVLRALGSHWSECENVYQLYRDFLKNSISDPTTLNARLRASYQGQLASPYFEGSDRVLSEYRAWSQYQEKPTDFTNEQDSIQRRLHAASSLLAKMQRFERDLDRVNTADTSALQALWFEYVGFVISRVTTLGCGIVISVLERSVAAVCMSADLWSRYLAFLRDKRMSTLAVAKRAVRNVPFAPAPWVALFVAMECEGASGDDISIVGNDLCQRQPCPLQQDALLDVLLAYCDAVRRRTASKALRQVAFTSCKAAVGNWTMGRCCLLMYESKCTFDVLKTGLHPKWIEIWDEILTHRGHEWTCWQTCIAECVRMGGSVAEVRSYYSRGVTEVKDYPVALAEAWVLFEREMSEHVRFWVEAKGIYDKLVQQYHASVYVPAHAPEEATKPSKKRLADGPAVGDFPKGRQDAATKAARQVEYKKQRLLDDSNHMTVFLCELNKAVTKEDLLELFAPCGNVVDVRMLLRNRESQASRGMAYVEFDTETAVEKALKLDKSPFHGHPLNVKLSKPTAPAPKQPVVKDGVWKTTSSTIYVTGFGDNSTEDSLKTAFSKFGLVHAVMILGRKQKKNVYALVEFAPTENVDNILTAVEGNGPVDGASVQVKRARFSVEEMQAQQARTKATQKPHVAQPQREPSTHLKAEKDKKPVEKIKDVEAHEHGQKPRIALSLVPRSLKSSKDAGKRPSKMIANDASKVKETAGVDTLNPATTSMKSNADFRKLYSSN